MSSKLASQTHKPCRESAVGCFVCVARRFCQEALSRCRGARTWTGPTPCAVHSLSKGRGLVRLHLVVRYLPFVMKLIRTCLGRVWRLPQLEKECEEVNLPIHLSGPRSARHGILRVEQSNQRGPDEPESLTTLESGALYPVCASV